MTTANEWRREMEGRVMALETVMALLLSRLGHSGLPVVVPTPAEIEAAGRRDTAEWIDPAFEMWRDMILTLARSLSERRARGEGEGGPAG